MAQGSRSSSTLEVDRLLHVLRTQGPVSQTALARALGLAPASISRRVSDLERSGVVSTRRRDGRQNLVALAPPSAVVVGLEATDAGVRGALVDFRREVRIDLPEAPAASGSGTAEEPHEEPTAERAEAPLEASVRLVEELCRRAGLEIGEVTGVALGIRAPVSTRTGMIVPWSEGHLRRWSGIPLQSALTRRLGVRVMAENDANLAALAEWTWGAGRGCEHLQHLLCGSGIGGAFILGGTIYHGSDGLAGEIGHLVLDPSGPVCYCGSRGCLTAFASERSILRALEESGSPAGSLAEVIHRAETDDAAARAVLWEAGRSIGRAAYAAAKMVSPSRIVIGGPLAAAGDLLHESIGADIQSASLAAASHIPQVVPAYFQDDAVLLGAVALVLAGSQQGVHELPTWLVDDSGAAAGAAAVTR